MSRMMTLLPLVYRKFFPFGSPPSTMGCPRCVRGNVEYMYSETDNTRFTRSVRRRFRGKRPPSEMTHCLNRTWRAFARQNVDVVSALGTCRAEDATKIARRFHDNTWTITTPNRNSQSRYFHGIPCRFPVETRYAADDKRVSWLISSVAAWTARIAI